MSSRLPDAVPVELAVGLVVSVAPTTIGPLDVSGADDVVLGLEFVNAGAALLSLALEADDGSGVWAPVLREDAGEALVYQVDATVSPGAVVCPAVGERMRWSATTDAGTVTAHVLAVRTRP